MGSGNTKEIPVWGTPINDTKSSLPDWGNPVDEKKNPLENGSNSDGVDLPFFGKVGTSKAPLNTPVNREPETGIPIISLDKSDAEANLLSPDTFSNYILNPLSAIKENNKPTVKSLDVIERQQFNTQNGEFKSKPEQDVLLQTIISERDNPVAKYNKGKLFLEQDMANHVQDEKFNSYFLNPASVVSKNSEEVKKDILDEGEAMVDGRIPSITYANARKAEIDKQIADLKNQQYVSDGASMGSIASGGSSSKAENYDELQGKINDLTAYREQLVNYTEPIAKVQVFRATKERPVDPNDPASQIVNHWGDVIGTRTAEENKYREIGMNYTALFEPITVENKKKSLDSGGDNVRNSDIVAIENYGYEKQGIITSIEALDILHSQGKIEDNIYEAERGKLLRTNNQLINKYPVVRMQNIKGALGQILDSNRDVENSVTNISGTGNVVGLKSLWENIIHAGYSDKEVQSAIDELNAKGANISKKEADFLINSKSDIGNTALLGRAIGGTVNFENKLETTVGLQSEIYYENSKHILEQRFANTPNKATEQPQTIISTEGDIENNPQFLQPIKNPDAGLHNWGWGTVNLVADGVGTLAKLYALTELTGGLADAVIGSEVGTEVVGLAANARLGKIVEQTALSAGQRQTIGTIAGMYLDTYQDAKEAAKNFIGDEQGGEQAREMYANLMGLANGVAWTILPANKIVQDITAKSALVGAEDFAKLIPNEGIAGLKENTVAKFLENTLKNTAEAQGKMTGISGITQVAQYAAQAMYNPQSVESRNLGQEVVDGALQGLSFLPITLLEGRGIAKNIENVNEFTKEAIYRVSADPVAFKDYTELQVKKGDITQQQANAKVQLINTMFDIRTKDVPNDLTKQEKVEYANNLLFTRKLQAENESIKDPVQTKKNDEKIAELEKRRQEILDNSTGKLPTQEAVSEPIIGETAQPKDAIELLNQARDGGKLGVFKDMEDEAALKMIAQQAQNLDTNGKPYEGTDAAERATMALNGTINQFGKELVDAAIEKYPTEIISSQSNIKNESKKDSNQNVGQQGGENSNQQEGNAIPNSKDQERQSEEMTNATASEKGAVVSPPTELSTETSKATITVPIKIDGREMDAKYLDEHKGQKIVEIDGDVYTYDPKNEILFKVALDDSKTGGNVKKVNQEANNIQSAKDYIDWAQSTRKENTEPTTIDVTPKGNDVVVDKRSDADIEKRMMEIEEGKGDMSEFNSLEKEMEKRERATVFDVPLDKVNDSVDALMKKEKEQPNGYGSFIERRDARETKEVADKYSNPKDISDAELKNDFKEALMGKPATWYADGLKLRESMKEASNRGIDINEMLKEVEKEFTKDGFSIEEAKKVIAGYLEPIFKKSENKPSLNEEGKDTKVPDPKKEGSVADVSTTETILPTESKEAGGKEPPKEPTEPVVGDENLPERRFTKQMLRSDELSAESKTEISKTLNYVRQTHEMTLKEANDVIDKVGLDEAQNLVINDNELLPVVRNAVGMILIKKFNELSEKATDQTTKDYYLDKSIQTATAVTERYGTEAGQSIEIFKLWAQLSPEGQLRAANQDMARQGKEKLRRREKDIKVISDKFKKANEEAADEVAKNKTVKDAATKTESQRVKKAKDKIAEAKTKRENILNKYKGEKGKNLYVGIGLTKEGIEFVGDLVKTYVQEGVAKLEIVVDRVLNHLKEISGKEPTDEVIKNVNEIVTEQLYRVENDAIRKGIVELEKEVSKSIKEHSSLPSGIPKEVKEKIVSDFADKYNVDAKEVSAEFDNIVTRKTKEEIPLTEQQKITKGLADMEANISKIIKEHYTVSDETKTSLVDKLVNGLGLEKGEAEKLAKEVSEEFDKIATRKKRNILYNEKARFDKINSTLQGSKKPEKKTVAEDLIKYSNLGAFDAKEFADMVASKFGLGEISPAQAAKLIELAKKVQKAPEGSPKNNATEDLLAYRANLHGSDWGSVAQSVWYANVLSGYKTHEKNLVSTFFNSMGELGAEMAKDPKSIPYLLAGYLKGVGTRGLVEAAHTLKTGYSPIHIKKIEVPNVLERKDFVGGAVNPGNWFKYIMRLMVAEDVLSFQGLKEARAYQLARKEVAQKGFNTFSKKGWDEVNKVLFHTKERYDAAFEQIKEEGLLNDKGKPTLEGRRRIYELMENSRPTEMVEDAYGFAAHGTFNHESEGTLGAVTNAVAQALDAVNIAGVKPARFIVPFTRIITNVVNNSLDFTPVGAIRAARGIRGFRTFEDNRFTKGAFKELSKDERQRLIAKAAIGIGLTAVLQAMHQAGVIQITGGGTGDPKKDEQLRQEGWQEYSIKIGDKYYSYKYTPLVFMTGFLGNMNDAEKYGGQDADTTIKQMEIAASRMGGQVADMTWINSASTFLGALTEKNPNQQASAVSKSLAGMAKGFIPYAGAVTQTTQLYESIFNQPKKQTTNAWQSIIADVPIARNSLNDKINVLGDPIQTDSDVLVSSENREPVLKYLLDKDAWVAPVNKNTIEVFDEDTEMDRPITNDEYYEFSKLRGQKIKNQLTDLLINGSTIINGKEKEIVSAQELTSKQVQKILHEIATEATKDAKKELFQPKPKVVKEKITINQF